jgi:hypothetical protein
MKFREGDLLVDIQERVLCYYTPDKKSYLHRCRLATPGETLLFKKNFPNKQECSFAEFKDVMPVFDGRRLNGVIYDHIYLDERAYIFFRDTQLKYPATNTDKLHELIFNYERAIQHNKKEQTVELKKARKIRACLRELITLAGDEL